MLKKHNGSLPARTLCIHHASLLEASGSDRVTPVYITIAEYCDLQCQRVRVVFEVFFDCRVRLSVGGHPRIWFLDVMRESSQNENHLKHPRRRPNNPDIADSAVFDARNPEQCLRGAMNGSSRCEALDPRES